MYTKAYKLRLWGGVGERERERDFYLGHGRRGLVGGEVQTNTSLLIYSCGGICLGWVMYVRYTHYLSIHLSTIRSVVCLYLECGLSVPASLSWTFLWR